MEKSDTTKFVVKPSFDLQSSIISIALDFTNNFPVKFEAITKDLENALKVWEGKRKISANTLFIMNSDQKRKELSEILNILERSFEHVFTNQKLLDRALEIVKSNFEHDLIIPS
jgi:hypothetical protein